MRFRRYAIRLLIFAAVACCASFAYFAYGKYRVASLEKACDAAREAKQWPQLESLATQWIAWDQTKAQPWLYAAEAATEQGDDLRTATYLYYIPNDDPRTPSALLELSHLQFGNLNQPLAAAETCRRIIRLQPDHSEAHRRLVFFYAMSRQRFAMIEEARRAIDVGCDVPESYLYLIGADWMVFANGAELNQRWLQSSPNNEDFLVAQAYHYISTAALDESVDLIPGEGEVLSTAARSERIMGELLERYPHNLELLAFHLDRATFQGNSERVVELLSLAPPAAAKDSRFWRFKGWVHEHRGELDEAEQAYLEALQLYPYDWQTQHNLAAVYRRRQDLPQVELYQNVAKLGKEVARDSLQAPDTRSLSNELLDKIARYAELCGEETVAKRLRERIGSRSSE